MKAKRSMFLTTPLLSLACAAGGLVGTAALLAPGTALADHQHPGTASTHGSAKPVVKTKAQVAAVEVSGAWVRATVPGQSGTGGFMSLRSKDGPLQLVGFSTPVAGSAELHEMAMDGNVMRMRPVASLDLPAGQAVELKPGGHHLMLMSLKTPLKAGASVPVVLQLKTPEGRVLEQRVSVPVRSAAPVGAPADDAHEHDHHDH